MTTVETFEHQAIGAPDQETLRQNWGKLLALGIFWIILGSIAIILPLAATLASDLVFGCIFLIGGIVQLVLSFSVRSWRGFAMHLIRGLLSLLLGGLLLAFPIAGIISLTALLGAFFIVEGIVMTVLALQHRGPSWGWLLVSGLVSLVLGAFIGWGLPVTAAWVLGTLVGVELLFYGWGLVMLAVVARRGDATATPAATRA